ncbi:MAG: response regulator [bacterium]
MVVKGKQNGTLVVLVASTDEYFKERVLKVLNQKKHLVTIVNSCRKALEYILERKFDLIIYDPDIRGLDGANAVKLIKKIRPNTPLIVASNEKSSETGVQIAELGVYFRLGKPIDEKITQELVHAVEQRAKK